MAKSGFKGRERVWQSYSKKLWSRIVKNCKAGLIEVRADLRWFHELFEAAPSVQKEIFGKSYPEVTEVSSLRSFAYGLIDYCFSNRHLRSL